MESQQGPTVLHRELCSMLRGCLDGRGVWGRTDTCIWTAEALCYPPETITTLLTGYTPIQNKRTVKKYFCELIDILNGFSTDELG